MTRVSLNRYELRAAASAGVERRILGIAKGRPPLHGAEERKNEWQIDIMGAVSEYAFAKYLNVYWEPATDEKLDSLPGDVGTYQVRSTGYPNGNLIVYESDKDDAVFALGIVGDRYVDFVGWQYGSTAKAVGEKRKEGRRAEYWVKQHQLQPMHLLPPDTAPMTPKLAS